MGGGHDHDRSARGAQPAYAGDADRGVRVDQLAGFVERGDHGPGRLGLGHAAAGEQFAHRRQRLGRDVDDAGLGEGLERPRGLDRIAPHALEIEPLEVGSGLDVHRRRLGRRDLAAGVAALLEGARQDVVGVGRRYNAGDRQAHALGHVACEGVAEVARGDDVRNLAVGGAERHGGGEVVDRLGDDAGEVDRIDARQVHGLPQGRVLEGLLHQRLAVVEVALNGDARDVVLGRGGHEPALDLGDPPFGEEGDHLDALAAAEGFDRRPAGVARSGAEDGLRAALTGQEALVQPRQQLHGDILERQARPVEQLGQEHAGRQLGQRHDRRVGEAGVGLLAHLQRFVGGQLLAGELAEHGGGHLGVGPPGKAGDLLAGEARPFLRHIETAVGSQPAQHRIQETDRRGPAPRRDVPHRIFHLRQSTAA
jgi:hypothetical protein